jgi:hypothetical protein
MGDHTGANRRIGLLCNLLLILKLVAHAMAPPDVYILTKTHIYLIKKKARLQYILKEHRYYMRIKPIDLVGEK